MAQTVGPNEQLPDAIGKLASDTTELGIVVGDMFRYACAGLFGQEPETARFVAESLTWVAQATKTLDQRVRSIIQVYGPSADEMRRIAELQHAARQYARIAERSTRIADQALSLRGAGEQTLASVTADSPATLYALISLVYEQMRGVFLVTAARDTKQARTLIARHAEVDAYFDVIRLRLTNSVRSNHTAALNLHRLVVVAQDMREIGEAVVAICKATL